MSKPLPVAVQRTKVLLQKHYGTDELVATQIADDINEHFGQNVITDATVRKWLKGHVTNYNNVLLPVFRQFLGVTYDELLQDE